nr:MAG TPA: hypothetical protein [Caudoviricetes sp.]
MKARLHPTPALQKAVDEYAEEKIKDIQSRAYEAVMKERNDIATSATTLPRGQHIFACWPVIRRGYPAGRWLKSRIT